MADGVTQQPRNRAYLSGDYTQDCPNWNIIKSSLTKSEWWYPIFYGAANTYIGTHAAASKTPFPSRELQR
eukprot:scaffold2915_cov181-Amphora_coffeaeformis.AAC.6